MQTRTMSLLESAANFITAFVLGWLVIYLLVPVIWGVKSNETQPIALVLLLNFLSTVRHYVWRRIFNIWDKRNK